jgi:hypothetical protein
MSKKKNLTGSPTQLAKLRETFEAARAQIQTLDYMIPGTLQKRLYRCGKANCRCKSQGPLHGPYYQWTRKIDGKTVNISLDPKSATRVKECIQNNRKLRQLCRQMEKASLAALQITTPMHKT